jgi:hypothetical protein
MAVLEQGRQIGQSMHSGILCFQADLCAALFALDEGDESAVRARCKALSPSVQRRTISTTTASAPR